MVEFIMKINKLTLVGAVLILVSSALLTGCNTVKGFGQDMQAGGQELQRAAVQNQN
jgi:predicted small secreted protein